MMARWHRALAAALFLGVLGGCASPEHPPAVSVFDDENIEKEAIARINSAGTWDAHVNVTSFKRRVLLTGQVPNAGVREELARIAGAVPKVRGVANELVVGNITGISSRTSDSWVTSDVKFRLMKGTMPSDDILVTTENGVVFLMGTLRRNQGAAAAELAATTRGVRRVVLVFEYLD